LEQQLAFEETCERYLLGELSEAEREQFEESYFADDALFDRFLAVKDELLDAYARGELAEEKRTRFAQHFLAIAPRRQQLDETQEFIRVVTAVSTKTNEAKAPLAVTTHKSEWWKSLVDFFKLRSFALPTALEAALLLIGLSGSLVLMPIWFPNEQEEVALNTISIDSPTNENNNTAPSLAPANINQSVANANVAVKPAPKKPVNTNQSPANINAAPNPTNKLKMTELTIKPANTNVAVASNPTPRLMRNERDPPVVIARRPPTHIAFIMLLPVASRDINKANTLRLSSDTQVVRVGLNFKSGDYRNYSATLTTVAGASIWQQKTLKTNTGGANKSVTLQFAPELLRQQDYIVTLKGQTAAGQTETIGEYYFRVERNSSQNKQTQTPQP
jgi:hypothetical protein